jgi:hypothetical protein
MEMIRRKFLNIGHDDILSMENFRLMIKNHISLQIFDCQAKKESSGTNNWELDDFFQYSTMADDYIYLRHTI